ncbi:MAG: high-affinity branched-chain amino acid ABC transporter permease LivM [Rhizobiales bacterium]|nr:high-affinity branched-chain amino acid ABC transporter permease LivM [Hyphomicrobiales bacterium]
MVLLRTTDRNSKLVIEYHWEEMLFALILLVVGRLGLIFLDKQKPMPTLIIGLAMAIAGWTFEFPTEVLEVFMLAAGIILIIRAGLALWREAKGVTENDRENGKKRRELLLKHSTGYITIVVIAIAVILPFLTDLLQFILPSIWGDSGFVVGLSSRYVVDVFTLIFTYILLAWGLNIVVGYAGLLDLGFVAFYAVGSYSFAILARDFNLGFWTALPLAGIIAMTSGLVLGFPVLKLRGDYFAIVTLGFGEIVRILLLNLYDLTGGPDGINGIPRPGFGNVVFARTAKVDGTQTFTDFFSNTFWQIDYSTTHRIIFLYYIVLVLCMLVAIFTIRIRKQPLGRAWEALRENEIAAASLGINRTNIKLAAFAISATWGGFAGAFFASRQGFISPESYTFIESAIILAIVVMGGMGNLMGIALAAIILIGLPELFRDLNEYRMAAFGFGLVLIMIWRPTGLISFRDPTVLLFGKKKREHEEAVDATKEGNS